MAGFENWKTPYKVKRENLVSLPLTGAACETVEIVDPWDTEVLDYRLIQTRTRRAWKGFWLVCLFVCLFFSRFQEFFLLELVSCWVDLPKGSFQWKFAKNLATTKILKKTWTSGAYHVRITLIMIALFIQSIASVPCIVSYNTFKIFK